MQSYGHSKDDVSEDVNAIVAHHRITEVTGKGVQRLNRLGSFNTFNLQHVFRETSESSGESRMQRENVCAKNDKNNKVG